MNLAVAGVGAHVLGALPASGSDPPRAGWDSRLHVEGTTPNVALAAAWAALRAAGITPQELDLIIVATASPDAPFPATACLLQTELGAPPAGSFDVLAAEAGFLYALSVADAYVRSGVHAAALVVGADSPCPKVPIGTDQRQHVTESAAGAVILATGRTGPLFLGCRLGLVNGAAGFGEQVRALLPGDARVTHALVPPAMERLGGDVLRGAGIDPAVIQRPAAVPPGAPNAYLPVALARLLAAGQLRADDTALLLSSGAGGVWGAAAVRGRD